MLLTTFYISHKNGVKIFIFLLWFINKGHTNGCPQVMVNNLVGPEIWGPGPLCVKGPKPCPIKPNHRGHTIQLPEGPRTWLRTTSRPTSHKNAWRKGQIQYKSSSREKAANTLMRSPAPDKPILTPCYPAFPNHSDVWIDETSNHPKQEKTDT